MPNCGNRRAAAPLSCALREVEVYHVINAHHRVWVHYHDSSLYSWGQCSLAVAMQTKCGLPLEPLWRHLEHLGASARVYSFCYYFSNKHGVFRAKELARRGILTTELYHGDN